MTVPVMPGVGSEVSAAHRAVLLTDAGIVRLPQGRTINGSLSRDPGNTGDVNVLRAGLLLGKIAASGKYAPSILGVTQAALASAGTTLKMTVAAATELVRRIGSTGTFKVTGPASAGGTVRTLTATYSAVGLTGAAANEVQSIAFTGAGTAGTVRIGVPRIGGGLTWTTAIAYNATIATIQAALDVASGVANGVVVTAAGGAVTPFSTPVTPIVLTYSGTGYAALPQVPAEVDFQDATGLSLPVNTRTTFGQAAAGDVTITALGVNEVQTVVMNIASTGGNVAMKYFDPTTQSWRNISAAAWSATDATYLSNIQAQLDLATGVANGIVVTARPAVDTDLGFVLTFSGTGYAGIAHPPVEVVTYPTSTTMATVTRTTAGVPGAMVVGSLIQPTDGSSVPLSFVPDGYGICVTDENAASVDVPLPELVIGGVVDVTKIVDYPQDASLKAWLKAALRAVGVGFAFTDDF